MKKKARRRKLERYTKLLLDARKQQKQSRRNDPRTPAKAH